MKTIIFIESNTSGTGEIFISKSIFYGFKVVFLTTNQELYSFLDKYTEIDIIKLDTSDEREITNFCINYINQGNTIKAVVSSSEYYIEMASKIANFFNLPCADTLAIKNCRNKFMQYSILSKNKINVPKTQIIEKQEEIKEKISNVSYPIIIKPIEGTGSVGVRLCNSPEECYSFITPLLLLKNNERNLKVDNRVLIQEFIEGNEFSAEVFNGELIGVTKKYLSNPPFFVEIGHDFPAILDEKQYLTIKNSISKIIQTLNLKWGACHIEFRMHEDEFFLIEVNPRLAGGFIPEIVRKATGIDLIDNQIRAALGLTTNLIKTNNDRFGIRFIIPSRDGYIKPFETKINKLGISEVKRYKPINSLFKKYGDFRDRVGHIIFDMSIITSREIEEIIQKTDILECDKDERHR